MFRVEIHINNNSKRNGTYMDKVDTLEEVREFVNNRKQSGDLVKIWDMSKTMTQVPHKEILIK